MKTLRHAFPENSLLGTCIMLAHSTFYDALPSNAQQRGPTAAAEVSGKRAPREGILQRWATALDNWSHRQHMKQRDAYLAQAQDVFELEDRIRRLERRPYY
jgi:hypothetical protein